jgi:hypothetical protein
MAEDKTVPLTEPEFVPPGHGAGFHPASFVEDDNTVALTGRATIRAAAAGSLTVIDTPLPLRMAAIEAKISQDPNASAVLAADTARQIQAALDQLDAQKPNETDALEGYANISRVLISWKIGFEAVAFEIELSNSAISTEVKASRIRRAAEAALKVSDEIVSYIEDNTSKVALVIAQMGLAGIISSALSHFGIPEVLSFSMTIAGLNDVNLWEAIKSLASKDKPEK